MLIGPAFPVNLSEPPAGKSAVIWKGNDDVNEKLVISIFTLSYIRSFWVESARDTVRRPSLTLSLVTDKLGAAAGVEAAASDAGAVAGGFEFAAAREDFGDEAGAVFSAAGSDGAVTEVPGFVPRLEKFHFCPSSDFTRLICGFSSVNSVTLMVREKMSGIISTPTFNDFACTNGALLNWGSSAMAMLSAETPPESSDKERLPTVTGRPRASVNSDSSFGLKVFASMMKGSAIRRMIRTPIMMAKIFRKRFMTLPPRGAATCGYA